MMNDESKSSVPKSADGTKPHSPSFRWKRVAVLLLLVLAAGFVYWFFHLKTYHLETVKSGELYRDGNQGLREFGNAIDKVKPKTVVSLVDEEEFRSEKKQQFAAEAQMLKDRNVNFERIPVQLGGYPTSEDVQRFLKLTSEPDRKPVLVHCAQGIRRTGMFVAAYQMSVLGYDKEKAKQEIQSFGHSDRTVNDIKKFIDQYDPATRTVPKIERSGVNE